MDLFKELAETIESARLNANVHNKTFYVFDDGTEFKITVTEPDAVNFICGVLPHGEIFTSM